MAKVVLITGCSSGLGRALAQRMHAEGAGGERAYRVFASARNLASLRELEAAGLDVVQLDVTDQKSVDSAVRRVIQRAGRIDVLVNNAGLSRVGPIVEQPLSEMQEVMEANLFGVVRVMQAVAPHMMRQRSGLIVQIGSIVSMLASPFGGIYSASKAALLSLTDALRLELEPFGVHVTYCASGAIKSAFSDNVLAGTNVARYERAESLYAPLAHIITERALVSQDPKTCVSADTAAGQIAAVINRSALPPSSARGAAAAAAGERGKWTPRQPPTWFLAAGNARLWWTMGVIQKLWGWPVNSLIQKAFKMDKKLE